MMRRASTARRSKAWRPFLWMKVLFVLWVLIMIRTSFRVLAPEELSEACIALIHDKQAFIDAYHEGLKPQMKCTDLPEIKIQRRGKRPATDYDIQEFLHRSAKNRASHAPTVAVQLSIDRLAHLDAMGKTWHGHISASVFIPAPRHTPEAQSHLLDLLSFFEDIEDHQLYSIDIGVVFALNGTLEAIKSELMQNMEIPLEQRYRYLYPVNVGRNVALSQVQTELVLLLDADFVFSKDILAAATGGIWQNVLCAIRERAKAGKGTLAVIPAFETGKDRAAPEDIASLKKDYSGGVLRRMSGTLVTHCPTDYARWMESETDYSIQWDQFYEPYGIAPTDLLPWYPEEFKGYHLNKIMIFYEIAVSGWEFVVLPQHFVVHLWHPPSASKNLIKSTSDIFSFINSLKDAFVNELASRDNTCDVDVMSENIHYPAHKKRHMQIARNVQNADNVHTFDEMTCP